MTAPTTDAAGRPGRSAPEVKAPAAGRAFSKDTRHGTDSGIIAEDRAGGLPALQRNQWARVTLTDGSTHTYRFVRAGTLAWSRQCNERVWSVDHGAYGRERDDGFLRESAIVSAVPAQRPTLLLTYRDPFGHVRRLGRYATHAEAEAAALQQRYVTDVRIEDVRP